MTVVITIHFITFLTVHTIFYDDFKFNRVRMDSGFKKEAKKSLKRLYPPLKYGFWKIHCVCYFPCCYCENWYHTAYGECRIADSGCRMANSDRWMVG